MRRAQGSPQRQQQIERKYVGRRVRVHEALFSRRPFTARVVGVSWGRSETWTLRVEKRSGRTDWTWLSQCTLLKVSV